MRAVGQCPRAGVRARLRVGEERRGLGEPLRDTTSPLVKKSSISRRTGGLVEAQPIDRTLLRLMKKSTFWPLATGPANSIVELSRFESPGSADRADELV